MTNVLSLASLCVFSGPLLGLRPGLEPGGDLVIADPTAIVSRSLDGSEARWKFVPESGAFAGARLLVVEDPAGSTVLVSATDAQGNAVVVALDGETGEQLWAHAGYVNSSETVYFRGETHGFPLDAADFDEDGSPDVIVHQQVGDSMTSWVLDSRSGKEIFQKTFDSATYGNRFLPGCDEAQKEDRYHLLFASGNDSMRFVEVPGGREIWTRPEHHRHGVFAGDITGDGCPDIIAEQSNWSDNIIALDGVTGGIIWQKRYGAFDILSAISVPTATGQDVILAAQNSSATEESLGGGLRRIQAVDGAMVWECHPRYNNQTISTVLKRADGWTIVSGWRHQRTAIGVDLDSGIVLWKDVETWDADFVGVPLPDQDGDGSEDIYSQILPGSYGAYSGAGGTPLSAPSALSGVLGVAYNPFVAGVRFVRGDSNSDGALDLSDAVFTLLHLFRGGPPPGCERAADADGDRALSLTDAVFLLSHLFRGGPAPSAPFPACGVDRSQSPLGCAQQGC